MFPRPCRRGPSTLLVHSTPGRCDWSSARCRPRRETKFCSRSRRAVSAAPTCTSLRATCHRGVRQPFLVTRLWAGWSTAAQTSIASISAPESAWRGSDEPAGDVAGASAAGRTCARGRPTRVGTPTAASRPIAPCPPPSAMCCRTTLPPTTWHHCCAPASSVTARCSERTSHPAAASASTASVPQRTSRRRWRLHAGPGCTS